jgi:hypothetical protein
MTPPAQGLRAVATSQALYAALASGNVAKVADFVPKIT